MPAPRKDGQASAMYARYLEGLSLEQVASAWGVTRQSVYEAFKSRAFALRPRPAPLPWIEYRGERYTRDRRGYYRSTSERRHTKYLHHEVWRAHFGDIPVGHDIHHRDGDQTNNEPGNLQCLTKAEHTRLHNPLQPIARRRCAYCLAPLVRRVTAAGALEVPAALAKRRFCNPECVHRWSAGRPRGSRAESVAA